MFWIYCKLENGEFVDIASRETCEEAEILVTQLSQHWSAEYGIKEAEAVKPEPVPTKNSVHARTSMSQLASAV